MNIEMRQLEAAIEALEAQRGLLGDAVVDTMLAPARAKLAALANAAAVTIAPPEPIQTLKQVTILFLDVVGSTTLSQHLDPEAISAVMDDALSRGTVIVEAHRGKVLQYAGDNILAVFGADEAREDDAERAVHCGLALLDLGKTLRLEVQAVHGHAGFNVRAGIHTGGVLLGGGVDADASIRGSAVNIAARMEQTAPAGALRMSHDTFAQVRGLFEVDAQEPLTVKGVDAAVQSYLVRAALNRHVAGVERGLQGLSTPMVGRQGELHRLLHAVSRARESRQLQAVTLVGDAGVGKSRLLREWKAVLAGDPLSFRVLAVRCQPDGMLRSWGLLRSLLAVQFGVADTDSAELARRKIVNGLSPWFAERGERQAQLIGQLSGHEFGDSPHLRGLDPRSLRDQALSAFRDYLRALSVSGEALPLLVVEDLHWADDGSLDVLQYLLAHAGELPLVLIMTSRPELLARRPEWSTPETTLWLTPLPAEHAGALAHALLKRIEHVPPRLTEFVVGQAEGNPYYMEELVRRLIDDHVIVVGEPHWTVQAGRLDSARLPATLVGLLQARLDALPPGERQAARHASVIGHVFWDEALQRLDANAPQALPALQRAALVRAHETSDFEGTTERQFDHHLLHQVTYDTVLKAERRLGHGAVARWLRERTQGRGAEFLAMTGEHAERAGDTVLAVDCFEQAGKEAQKRFANATAVSWLRHAVTLLGNAEPARRFDLLMRLSEIADTMGDRFAQDAAHLEVSTILERDPDDHRQAELWFAMALLADRRSDNAKSEQLSWQAFNLAERCSAARWAALAQGNLAWLQIARQDYVGASRHIEMGLSWAGRIESENDRAEVEAKLLTLSGMASILLCRLHVARSALTAVLSRGEALGNARLQLGALDNLALIAYYLGRWDESAAWGERMRTLAQFTGSSRSVALAQLRLARAAEALEEPSAALRLHEQNLTVFHDTDDRRMEAVTLQYIGALQLKQGDVEAALQTCARAQTLHHALDEPIHACEVAGCTALCEVQLGTPDAALATVETLLARLNGELAKRPAHETIAMRWACQQVLESLGDTRASVLLEQLFTDVLARASELTDATDRDRLIEDLPYFRGIVAAHGRLGRSTTAG